MDPKQKQQPPAPNTVKARVRPNNRYGSFVAGEIVEVSEGELRIVPHCLVSLDDEKREQEVVDKTPSKTEQTRQELEGYRSMYAKQHEEMKRREADRMAKQSVQAAAEAKKILEDR